MGCYFLLARLYLNSEVYIGEKRYNECAQLCTDIIESNKYQLAENFKDNFVTENQNCPEIILLLHLMNC